MVGLEANDGRENGKVLKRKGPEAKTVVRGKNRLEHSNGRIEPRVLVEWFSK